jgi:phosphoglycolate phosphatase-like HAD superfamily hydrolase
MKSPVATVITDLDNTLYDWVAMWGAAFSAMLRVLVEQSGINQSIIEAEAPDVHRKYGTSEFSFLIESLPSLQREHPGRNLTEVYADAIRVYREAREASLRLFPTVMDTLTTLKAKGCLVIGYTDSRAFYSAYRIRKLGLDGVLDFLFSPPDHDLPGTTRDLRSQPPEAYEFKKTVHRHTPEGEVKPNPHVLGDIMRNVGATPARTVYIGDSLMKDVLMAQEAGVTDVFAKYGLAHHRDEYELLRRVSHWTDADIEREKKMKAEHNVYPSYTLTERFAELLDLFEFEPFAARPAA